jgi:pimeloyl-ACP methyl ester carboxylesterase
MSRPRKTTLLALVTITLGLAILVLPGLFRTAAVASNLTQAARQTVDTDGLIETDLYLGSGQAERSARIYQMDTRGPKTAILFVPGLTPNGIMNPRFVAVARSLARSGYVVITPRLSGFDSFRLEPAAIEEIGFWYGQMREKPWFPLRKAGIVGVSVGGTLALLAAARQPECRNVDFVVCIGGYQDLWRCQRRWFSNTHGADSHGRYPVQYYGKWILMLTALDAIQNRNDHDQLERALTDLVVTAKTSVSLSSLGAEGGLWYNLALGQEDMTTDAFLLARISQQLQASLQALTPAEELSAITCPVFLVHGAYDELIPAEETLELQKLLTSTRPVTLLTPAISHTHPLLDKLSFWSRSKALAEGSFFLYRFVRAS